MTNDDSNDLTERYNEIEGRLEGETLEDEWEASDGPDEEYGRPESRAVMERIEGVVWFHTTDYDGDLRYEGETIDVEE